MYPASKLNKQCDNIQPWCIPIQTPSLNQTGNNRLIQSIVSWPPYRFLRRQVRWSGIPISLRIFQFFVIHIVKGFSIVNEAEVDVFLEFQSFRICLLGNSFRRSWFWRLEETIHEKIPQLHVVNNQLVFATITPVITGTIHVFTSLVEVETFITPEGRLTPPQTLAAVSSEGSWRGGEDGEERRCHMVEGGWRREAPGQRGRSSCCGRQNVKVDYLRRLWCDVD